MLHYGGKLEESVRDQCCLFSEVLHSVSELLELDSGVNGAFAFVVDYAVQRVFDVGFATHN